MPRMLEIIGGHDQAKYFLRTNVSKLLVRAHITCGSTQIIVSRVIWPDHLGFTREVQICVDPHVMQKVAKTKSFLRTDVSKLLVRARITCGSTQIIVSRVIRPDHLGFTQEVLGRRKIGDSPGLMQAILNYEWWEMIFLDISNTPLPSSALGLGNRQFCVSLVYLRWSGLITRETQNWRFPRANAGHLIMDITRTFLIEQLHMYLPLH